MGSEVVFFRHRPFIIYIFKNEIKKDHSSLASFIRFPNSFGRNIPTETSGSLPEVMPNIPVGRNRNGPFHFNSNRNFRNLWHNEKHPRTQQTSYCVDFFRLLMYFINTWKQLTSWKDISFCKIRCLNLNIILLTMDSLKQTGRKRHCIFVWHIDTGSVVWTLIVNGKLANQIARLVAIVAKKLRIPCTLKRKADVS